jgi:ElaA protein
VSSNTYTATLRRSWSADLDAATLYELLRLRVAVFVVEQRSAYAELDGRDLESRARHYWLTSAEQPVLGCVRLLKERDGGYRIGRLCVAATVRGHGLGRQLMDAVLAEVGEGECLADVQQPLTEFYARYGFAPAGEPYDWAGMTHVPMRRARREPGS